MLGAIKGVLNSPEGYFKVQNGPDGFLELLTNGVLLSMNKEAGTLEESWKI